MLMDHHFLFMWTAILQGLPCTHHRTKALAHASACLEARRRQRRGCVKHAVTARTKTRLGTRNARDVIRTTRFQAQTKVRYHETNVFAKQDIIGGRTARSFRKKIRPSRLLRVQPSNAWTVAHLVLWAAAACRPHVKKNTAKAPRTCSKSVGFTAFLGIKQSWCHV